MSGRISTNMLYTNSTSAMLSLQASINKLNDQVNQQQRVLKPSDDPVAAARALDVTQSQAVNDQFHKNRQNAASLLTQTDSTISNVVTAVTEAKAQLISAGNATYSDQDRANIATTLQGIKQEMLGYANTTDGLGNYLFAGFKSSAPPFVDNGSAGISYNGDQGVQTLQVDSGRTMNVSVSGQALFQGGGVDFFKTISDLVTTLQTPISPAANATEAAASKVVFDTAYGQAITGLPTPTQADIDAAVAIATPAALASATNVATDAQTAHDTDYTRTDFTPGSTGAMNQALAKAGTALDKSLNNVVTVHAGIGANETELTALDNSGSAKDLQYTTTIDNLLGAGPDDLTKTISEMTQQQTYLLASQKTFSVISGLSLLNFIK